MPLQLQLRTRLHAPFAFSYPIDFNVSIPGGIEVQDVVETWNNDIKSRDHTINGKRFQAAQEMSPRRLLCASFLKAIEFLGDVFF